MKRDKLELELLGEQIAMHVAHLDAATHRLLTDLREFDLGGGWYPGARSCAQWLAWRVGWDGRTAREHLRVAHRLAELPLIDDALRRGEVSYAKVRAMTRVATPANEECLLEQARYSTGSQLERICRLYATVQRHDAGATPNDDRQRRQLVRRELADGMVRIEATLHAEEAAAVWAAIERVAAERCRSERGDSAEPPARVDPEGTEARVDQAGDPETAPHGSAEPPVLQDARSVSMLDPEIASHGTHVIDSYCDGFVDDAATREEVAKGAEHDPRRSSAVARELEVSGGPPEPWFGHDSVDSGGGLIEIPVTDGGSERVPLGHGSPACSAAGDHPIASDREMQPDVAHGAGCGERGSAEPPILRDPAQLSGAHAAKPIGGFDRAGALVELAQAVLRGTARDRAPIDLVVTVAAETLRVHDGCSDATSPSTSESTGDATEVAVLGDGACISAAAARRLGCDCGVIDVVEDEGGVPLSIGRKRRTIPGSMKRALRRRDDTCRFPGCTARVFLEGHHIQHWADGGPTETANIVLMCGWHHRHVHEYGYTIHGNADQEIRFVDPRGRELKDVPVRHVGPALGWPTIFAGNTELGITADTPACGFSGDPVDYVACIDEIVRADERGSD